MQYLSQNESLKGIIKELNHNNFNEKLNENSKSSQSNDSLKDKLLIINETELYETKDNLLNLEVFPAKNFNVIDGEINLEMTDIRNYMNNETIKKENSNTKNVKNRKFKKQQTKIKYAIYSPEEEIILDEDYKGPILFQLNTSDYNYISVWTAIKKLILLCCVIFAALFYLIIPFIIRDFRN